MSKREIEKVAKMMNELGLTEITSEGSLFWGLIRSTIHLSKQNMSTAPIAAINNSIAQESAPKAAETKDLTGAITSPMVGVIYLSPDPTSKPFSVVGQKVSKGDTLCLVEAMKTFNPIKAPHDGTVTEILVKDGDTVEYGTPLIVVK